MQFKPLICEFLTSDIAKVHQRPKKEFFSILKVVSFVI